MKFSGEVGLGAVLCPTVSGVQSSFANSPLFLWAAKGLILRAA